ncbi:MarR family winged helix-turn-helix transcriptional regulator [Cryptosporangium sp. NPDC051539]|uniref:MarR family winged helix-turn-helix transcriptional regulator n=1 Tax=Cryptosporangium sp. NPDC051539 TaxID=3363962 RepID=UPI0037AE5331
MEKLLPRALRTRPSFAVIRLAALVRSDRAEKLAAVGLSQHQHGVLCCLDEFGPAAQKHVAARLGLDSGDLVAFLDGLQAAGLIHRARDEHDRRRQILHITPAGRQALERAEALLSDVADGPLGALDAAELAHLQELATRVLTHRAPHAWAPAAE